MMSARTSLEEVRTRRRSRRAAGPSASARRAASSQNTGARAYQRPGRQASCRTVRGWINKAVAHKDSRGRDAPPLSEVHDCIDVVFELFNKYMRLIQGLRVVNDVALPMWAVVLRTQWITDERWPEISEVVDSIRAERPT
jgi:hypothetical protein